MAYYHNEQNILVGAAEVFVGDTGDPAEPGTDVTDPVEGVTGPLATALKEAYKDAVEAGTPEEADWRPVGLTTGGVEFSYAPDFGEVEVDQWLDVAKMYKQRQSVTVSTTFAEATLENLLFAWGQPKDTWDRDDRTLRISAGSLGDKPVERGLLMVGQAPGLDGADTERVYHLFRALNVETSSMSLSRSEATGIPVSVRCLPTEAAGGADYGYIIDRTITTTTP